VTPVEFRGDLRHQKKTRVPGVSCDVVCVILRFAVLVEHRLVTDRQADRHRRTQHSAVQISEIGRMIYKFLHLNFKKAWYRCLAVGCRGSFVSTSESCRLAPFTEDIPATQPAIADPIQVRYLFVRYSQWLGSRVVSVLDSGAERPGFKSQPQRCRVTVLGNLFTPVVPLFTKQRNW